MVDLGVLVADVMPYLTGAAAVYGGAVVQKVTDAAGDAGADATVSLGRRLLRRLFASKRGDQVREAVTELGRQPGDETSAAVLKAQVMKALTQEPGLADDLAQLLGANYQVVVTHSQGVQVGSHNTQTNTFTSPPA
jgi:hypothetical protein